MYCVSPRCVARTGRPSRWVRSAFTVRRLASTTSASSKEGRKTVCPPNYKPPDTIAVLGGGLTGLTTAWYLSRWIPKAKIVIYEASNRLGGWIDTETVPVTTPDGQRGTVSFERGARMVQIYRQGVPKFDDMVFYEMVCAFAL
jgi:protoporphyrinogen/coproporphyrinogen III oxidase